MVLTCLTCDPFSMIGTPHISAVRVHLYLGPGPVIVENLGLYLVVLNQSMSVVVNRDPEIQSLSFPLASLTTYINLSDCNYKYSGCL